MSLLRTTAQRAVMKADLLDDLPAESRAYGVAELHTLLGVDTATAEDLVRSAEPLWDATERAGGLVDSWSGGEFCSMFAQVLRFIRSAANPSHAE